MFKYFKEMRELKKMKLQYEVLLLGKLYSFTKLFDGGSDILELANKMKDVDQKDIISELVKQIKSNEKSE